MKKTLLTCALLAFLSACSGSDSASPALQVESILGGEPGDGFERANAVRPFDFPTDHRVHPGFRNEWWYTVGNLRGSKGAEFGYQLTLFRTALRPGEPDSASGFATHAVWMAHIALTDIPAQKHYHASRFARDAAGLAGQEDAPFSVFVGDWSLTSTGETEAFPWRLQASTEEFGFDLVVSPEKALVLNGDRGLSHKGGEPGNASYYYSATRLRTEGEVAVNGEVVPVVGRSWLDREWSTSALAEGTVGWDWFSLQLDSGTDLMLYQLRESDGAAHPASSGTLTTKDGQSRYLDVDAFSLAPERWWESPDGRRYPVAWRVQVPEIAFDAVVESRVDAQWMNTAVVYWEGAVAVTSPEGGALGVGYLEMTGY